MKKNKKILIIAIIVLIILVAGCVLTYIFLNKEKSLNIDNELSNSISNIDNESSNQSTETDTLEDRVYQARIDTRIAEFNEKVTLESVKLKTEIMVQATSDDLPSITSICEGFAQELKTDLNIEKEDKTEGYMVTVIDSNTDSEGKYIIITYSSNDLRSSFPEDITKDKTYNEADKTWNGLKVIDDYYANSTMLARVIKIEGYTANMSTETVLCTFNTDNNVIISNSVFSE